MAHVSQLPAAAVAALLMTTLQKLVRLAPCRAGRRQVGRREEGKLEHCATGREIPWESERFSILLFSRRK